MDKKIEAQINRMIGVANIASHGLIDCNRSIKALKEGMLVMENEIIKLKEELAGLKKDIGSKSE